jgi:hypothetical protein
VNLRRVVVTALVLSAAVLSLAGCNSSTSVTTPVSLGSTPPAAPSNLVGTFNPGQGTDYLIWAASSSPSVIAHEVWQYSDNPAVNVGTLVGTVAVGTSYLALPTPMQNDILLYRVRAKSTNGTFSAFSATIGVQRHGAVQPGSPDPGPGFEPGVVVSH